MATNIDKALYQQPQGIEELAQDQHGKQLRLGELVGALGAGIIGKGLLSGGKSRRRQRDWILGCSAHEGLCRT